MFQKHRYPEKRTVVPNKGKVPRKRAWPCSPLPKLKGVSTSPTMSFEGQRRQLLESPEENRRAHWSPGQRVHRAFQRSGRGL